MDRQSRAYRRASEAKPVSNPEQQPPDRHYALEDNTIAWMRTHAGEVANTSSPERSEIGME